MSDDFFRFMLLGLMAVFFPFAFYHRLRSNTGEKLDRWQEGKFIMFGLRLGAIPFVAGSLLWLLDPTRMAWTSFPFPAWLRCGALVAVGCGGLLLVWAFHNLGSNLTDTVVTRHSHTLITTGPYRYVRHPFYVAVFLAAVAGSFAAANWFLLLSSTIPIGFLVARTRIEERKLVEKFGDDYREYLSNTGRFLPRF